LPVALVSDHALSCAFLKAFKALYDVAHSESLALLIWIYLAFKNTGEINRSCHFSTVNIKYSKYVNRIVQYSKITLTAEGFCKKYQYDKGHYSIGMSIKSTAVVCHSNIMLVTYNLLTSS
jgi:hypothetical protein